MPSLLFSNTHDKIINGSTSYAGRQNTSSTFELATGHRSADVFLKSTEENGHARKCAELRWIRSVSLETMKARVTEKECSVHLLENGTTYLRASVGIS